jgi:hypothetical protein
MSCADERISGDELLSDSYDISEVFDGAIFEVAAKSITIKEGDDIAGVDNSEADIDPSEAITVINIVHANRLSPTNYDKKAYTGHIKAYMQAIKKKLEGNGLNADEVKKFMQGASGAVKNILGRFDDFSFYTGESVSVSRCVRVLRAFDRIAELSCR